MAENENKLSDQQLKERWDKPEGKAFRDEIILQLQSEENEHAVDWKNLKVEISGKEKLWRGFPGVKEIKDEEEERATIIENIDGPLATGNTRWGDLRFIYFEYVQIQEAYLRFANLQNANLYNAKLENANLSDTNLQNADLNCAKLQHAELNLAELQHAKLNLANLQNAKLYEANLQNAELTVAQLQHAELKEAKLESAVLLGAQLQNANLNYATYRLKSFWWRIGLFRLLEKLGKDISRFRPTLLAGADLSGIKLGSSPTMRRKLLDEVYLEDFAGHHRIFYPLWLWTSNCGRSPVLVGLWAGLIGVFFGFAFAHYPWPSFLPDWAWLQGFFVVNQPMFDFIGDEWWRPYYHSITTLTTLGWGSVEPKTTAGFWWHTAENIMGYLMLGYLIAVIGDLLTRRSA